MTKRLAGRAAVVLMLVGCRSAPQSEPAPAPVRTPTQVAAIEPAGRAPAPVAQSLTPYEPDKERSDPSGSPCEWSCGDVHDCARVTGDYTPSAAAAIEIRCLGTCQASPERATLFGCGRPAAIEPGSCSPFLACVASAWPDQSRLRPPAPVVPDQDGCLLACTAYGRCWNTMTEPGDIARCAERCRQDLDAEAERKVGECAKLPSCMEIRRCVEQTPGA